MFCGAANARKSGPQADLPSAGFINRGGKSRIELCPRVVAVTGNLGDDAKHYQGDHKATVGIEEMSSADAKRLLNGQTRPMLCR